MKNKAIAITGGFGSLGLATALAAVELGARVAVIDRAAAAPATLTGGIGTDSTVLPGVDLADRAAATRALDAAAAHLNGLDILINTAGTFRSQKLMEGDTEVWRDMFTINLQTTVNACRAAIPHLRASSAGRIVNVGAMAAASQAGSGMGAYVASKSGVHRLTESLARELMQDRITVNAVLPSTIDTPANRAAMPDADFTAWVSPQALATIMFFLASDESGPITGALLPVTGRV